MKTPLLPKTPPASFAELLDLYPTLAELANLDYSEHLQGHSLVKTLDNAESKIRDTVFSVSQGGRTFLLRTDKWAYIQYDEDAMSGIELFDMEKDPEQYTNLAMDHAYDHIVAAFRKDLKNRLIQIRTNDLNLEYN